jgi:hypothetical protein
LILPNESSSAGLALFLLNFNSVELASAFVFTNVNTGLLAVPLVWVTSPFTVILKKCASGKVPLVVIYIIYLENSFS